MRPYEETKIFPAKSKVIWDIIPVLALLLFPDYSDIETKQFILLLGIVILMLFPSLKSILSKRPEIILSNDGISTKKKHFPWKEIKSISIDFSDGSSSLNLFDINHNLIENFIFDKWNINEVKLKELIFDYSNVDYFTNLKSSNNRPTSKRLALIYSAIWLVISIICFYSTLNSGKLNRISEIEGSLLHYRTDEINDEGDEETILNLKNYTYDFTIDKSTFNSFDIDAFDSIVKPGLPVKIFLKDKLADKQRIEVVQLTANGKNYIAEHKFWTGRRILTLIFGSASLFFSLYFLFKSRPPTKT